MLGVEVLATEPAGPVGAAVVVVGHTVGERRHQTNVPPPPKRGIDGIESDRLRPQAAAADVFWRHSSPRCRRFFSIYRLDDGDCFSALASGADFINQLFRQRLSDTVGGDDLGGGGAVAFGRQRCNYFDLGALCLTKLVATTVRIGCDNRVSALVY